MFEKHIKRHLSMFWSTMSIIYKLFVITIIKRNVRLIFQQIVLFELGLLVIQYVRLNLTFYMSYKLTYSNTWSVQNFLSGLVWLSLDEYSLSKICYLKTATNIYFDMMKLFSLSVLEVFKTLLASLLGNRSVLFVTVNSKTHFIRLN